HSGAFCCPELPVAARDGPVPGMTLEFDITLDELEMQDYASSPASSSLPTSCRATVRCTPRISSASSLPITTASASVAPCCCPTARASTTCPCFGPSCPTSTTTDH